MALSFDARVVYNVKTRKFSANGSIMLREPNGNVVEADTAERTTLPERARR